jgi:hypothetical protein
VVFTIWDVVGILRNHWTYSPLFTTGIHLGVMPLEELVFFTKLSAPIVIAQARRIWDAVCRAVIIPLGVLMNRNHDLYHYLWRSVVDFDSVTQFADRLVADGFEDAAHRTATGRQQGILHTFVARKPRENP